MFKKYALKVLIPIALLSVVIFFFNFLGAEDGLEFYLGICGTFLIVIYYRKHYEKLQ